jgi:hypothetical protein
MECQKAMSQPTVSRKVVSNKSAMKWSRRCLPGFVFIFLVGRLLAQGPSLKPTTIEIDSITGGAISSIPFDEPFVLRVRADEEPTFAFAIISFGKETAWEILKREDAKARRTGKESEVVDIMDRSRIRLTKDGGKTYVLVQFIEPEHRVPAGANLFVVFNSAETRGYAVLKLWHDGTVEKDPEKAKVLLEKAKNTADEIRAKQFKQLGFNYLAPASSELPAIYGSIKTSFNASDSLERVCVLHARDARVIPVPSFAGTLLGEALLDTLKATNGCLVDCDLNKDLVALSMMDTASLRLVVLGMRNIRETKAITAPGERLAALKATRSTLQRMMAYQQARSILNGAAAPSGWRSFMIEVEANVKALEAMTEQRKVISNVLNLDYAVPSMVTGTTQIYNFDTRSSFRMIPDFGLVWYGFQDGFSDVTPYFGVQFNVRQSKKNIPWRHYPNKTFWHHVSFTLGYTTKSMAAEGERDDFFNKASLILGAGYRLTDELRITGGALCFYGKDPNPAIDDRVLRATPYLGLSVDLDIAKYLNDLAKILKP